MPLPGYTLPRTPEGRGSLVPSPPWHYVGDFLVIEFWADPDAVAAVLPAGSRAVSRGSGPRCRALRRLAVVHRRTGRAVDPSRSQYKECFIVVNATLDGEHVTTCPYIWVDRDFALVRGWIQGFPKKLGSVWMTRTFGLGVPRRPGDPGRAPSSAGRSPRTTAGSPRARSRSSGSPRTGRPTTGRRSSTSGTSRGSQPGQHDDPAVHELVRALAAATVPSRRSGRGPRRSSCSAPRTRSTQRSRPCGWARGSGSRSATRWTISPRSAGCDG